jgi:hypothetical protein
MLIKITRTISEIREATLSERLAFKLGELHEICKGIDYPECKHDCILSGNCPFQPSVNKKLNEFLNSNEKV